MDEVVFLGGATVHLKDELTDLRTEPYFDYAVEGATASYGTIGIERAQLVRDRIEGLLA